MLVLNKNEVDLENTSAFYLLARQFSAHVLVFVIRV